MILQKDISKMHRELIESLNDISETNVFLNKQLIEKIGNIEESIKEHSDKIEEYYNNLTENYTGGPPWEQSIQTNIAHSREDIALICKFLSEIKDKLEKCIFYLLIGCLIICMSNFFK